MKTITLNITLPDGAKVSVSGSWEYEQLETPLTYTGPADRLVPFMLGLNKLPETDDGDFFILGWKFLELFSCKTEVIESGDWITLEM